MRLSQKWSPIFVCAASLPISALRAYLLVLEDYLTAQICFLYCFCFQQIGNTQIFRLRAIFSNLCKFLEFLHSRTSHALVFFKIEVFPLGIKKSTCSAAMQFLKYVYSKILNSEGRKHFKFSKFHKVFGIVDVEGADYDRFLEIFSN